MRTINHRRRVVAYVRGALMLLMAGCASSMRAPAESIPPTVRVTYPAEGARIATATPEIEILYADAESGIDVTKFRAVLNGEDHSVRFNHHSRGATGRVTASRRLPLGENRLLVEVMDRAGNVARREITFLNASGGWLQVIADPGAEPPRNVELILDASGSMREKIAFTTRMEVAKEAIRSLVGSIPAATRVGLRIFRDCDDIESIVPIESVDRDAFLEQVESIAPVLGTPLFASLLEAFDALAEFAEGQRIAVLLTDGEDSCEGDLDLAARRALDAATQVVVIGFDIANRAVTERLRAFAESTGGAFYDAQDPEQLRDALTRSLLRLEFGVFGDAGRPAGTGAVGSERLELDPGFYSIRLATVPPVVVNRVEIGPLTETVIHLQRGSSGLAFEVRGPNPALGFPKR